MASALLQLHQQQQQQQQSHQQQQQQQQQQEPQQQTEGVGGSGSSIGGGGGGSVTVVLVQQQRARRRPARYSPELSGGGGAQQTAAQQQSDMCLGGGDDSQQELTAEQEEQLLQGGLEDEELELPRNGQEMAPASTRKGRGRQKRKYKKRNANEDGAAAKKPRVANVLLENEMLIDEIRTRKALWMRTHEQHHSSQLTAVLWEEIAKILDVTQENIRRRWKSLKDHYRRELKKSMTDATAPPSAWPYYKKMRFMKSQMFVSLRRKNGEDHLEILSDDEEEISNQWSAQRPQKQEGDSDTLDDYEMAEYNQLIKYEQHMQDIAQSGMSANREEEEEEEEEEEQQQQEGEEEEQLQEQEEMSPIPSLQDQEELNVLQQQQAELSELSSISTLQQQPVIANDMSTMTTIAEMAGIPTAIVTTTASSLNGRLSHADLQQRTSDAVNAMNRSSTLSAMQEPSNMNGDLAEMDARHSALEQQRAEINGRLSAIQRNAEISAIQQRANISAMHQRAQSIAMQQRAEMQQRNGVVDNGVDNSNVSAIIGDDRGGISDDYHFFMSLMPHVRNFTSLQKLKVRNRIQQIIIEEATNCQYDPLGNC